MLILPTTYWGTEAWWKEARSGEVTIEVMESFPKQTSRNRCTILDPSGKEVVLSIPVKKVEHKQLTRDIEISYQQHWQHQHWNAILSAYKKTPYFDYYQDFIHPLYEREYRYLLDLNEATYGVVDSLLKNEMPTDSTYCRLLHTTDWAGLIFEEVSGPCILDKLFRFGPLAMI